MSKTNVSQVAVQVVGVSGLPEVKTVDLPKGKKQMLLSEVLKKAGVDAEHKDLLVDDKPANLKTKVGANAQVDVMERPRGS